MRLIDADALMEDLQYDVELDARALDSVDIVGDREVIQFDKDCKQNCIDLLLNAPTVDPVTHGRWIEENRRPKSSLFYCSECHRTAYDIQPARAEGWVKRCRYAYCPNCGAFMKGEQDETD